MRYKVTLACNGEIFEEQVNEVYKVTEGDKVYLFYDSALRVIFSAPFDSVIHVSLA